MQEEMNLDTRLVKFRQDFCRTLQLAHGWGFDDFFSQSVKELVEDLRALVASGAVTRDQVSFLAGMLRALMDSQTRWLLREAAVIEAASSVIQ